MSIPYESGGHSHEGGHLKPLENWFNELAMLPPQDGRVKGLYGMFDKTNERSPYHRIFHNPDSITAQDLERLAAGWAALGDRSAAGEKSATNLLVQQRDGMKFALGNNHNGKNYLGDILPKQLDGHRATNYGAYLAVKACDEEDDAFGLLPGTMGGVKLNKGVHGASQAVGGTGRAIAGALTGLVAAGASTGHYLYKKHKGNGSLGESIGLGRKIVGAGKNADRGLTNAYDRIARSHIWVPESVSKLQHQLALCVGAWAGLPKYEAESFKKVASDDPEFLMDFWERWLKESGTLKLWDEHAAKGNIPIVLERRLGRYVAAYDNVQRQGKKKGSFGGKFEGRVVAFDKNSFKTSEVDRRLGRIPQFRTRPQGELTPTGEITAVDPALPESVGSVATPPLVETAAPPAAHHAEYKVHRSGDADGVNQYLAQLLGTDKSHGFSSIINAEAKKADANLGQYAPAFVAVVLSAETNELNGHKPTGTDAVLITGGIHKAAERVERGEQPTLADRMVLINAVAKPEQREFNLVANDHEAAMARQALCTEARQVYPTYAGLADLEPQDPSLPLVSELIFLQMVGWFNERGQVMRAFDECPSEFKANQSRHVVDMAPEDFDVSKLPQPLQNVYNYCHNLVIDFDQRKSDAQDRNPFESMFN